MNEPKSKNEKLEEGRRFDPELLKKGLRCDLDQYEMLKRCSKKKDMTEWNKWHKEYPINILLEGAVLKDEYLFGADFTLANFRSAFFENTFLEKAKFAVSNLEDANIRNLSAKDANFMFSNLKKTKFTETQLQGAKFSTAIVDGWTLFNECKVDRKTNFQLVGLYSVQIDTGTRQLLEYNIRRKNWEGWYKEHRLLRWPVWLFWLISDYGLRSWRIIVTFFGLAIAFAVVYWLCPTFVMVNQVVGDIRGFWHALYFSVVTMTTLGFGDIAANPDSWGGQTLLMLQVILGYVLLGALVTRFAVLFTAGGPAGKFSNEQGKKGQGE